MATKVLVPLLGEGVEEVTVTKWLKREGDLIKELEPLLEVNTDKVDTEIPAPASGTVLKIVAPEGLPAKVGAILAFIGKPGESTEAVGDEGPVPPNQAPRIMGADAHVAKIAPGGGPRGFISPVVARVASEHGVDLSRIRGTGLNGRVTKDDVLRAVEGPPAASQYQGNVMADRLQARTPVAPGLADQLIKHSLIRRQIAEHMVLSQKTSPHVLTVMEADLSRVALHRGNHKSAFDSQGAKLSFTAYFIAAIVEGLKAHPMTNSTWTDEGVLIHGSMNIGMATSLGDDGLIVPVIKGAETLSLLEIARAVNDLANRARARRLQPDEVRGGTFTLTNHGSGGSLLAMPIINQQQCAILGTGAIQKRVVAVSDPAGSDAIAVRPMVYLSLVFDHRILDGGSADAFLGTVKERLEAWSPSD